MSSTFSGAGVRIDVYVYALRAAGDPNATH